MEFGLEHIPKKYTHIIGIDEAGRGPVAGPLAVGLVLVRRTEMVAIADLLPEVRDSKKLSAQKREAVAAEVRRQDFGQGLYHEVVFTEAGLIDEKGLSSVLATSVSLGLTELVRQAGIREKDVFVLLDGALSAPEQYKQQTIIRGDSKVFAIALASILAKVSRDMEMEEFDVQYPVYNFAGHKGYGTAEHMKLIKQHGLCPIHRQTFLKKYLTD